MKVTHWILIALILLFLLNAFTLYLVFIDLGAANATLSALVQLMLFVSGTKIL